MEGRTDYGPVLGSGCIHGLATLAAVFGGIFLFAVWKLPEYRQPAIGVFAIGLIPWAITLFRLYRLRRAIGKAGLNLDDPVPLGFSGTAIYARPLLDAEMISVEARLQCEEHYVRGSGKNKRTVTRVIYDEVLSPVVTPLMQRIEVRIPVRIPATGPATFWCDVARTKWWLRLKLRMRGCPNTASSFEIDVAPGMAER